jgi:hypothetical protein
MRNSLEAEGVYDSWAGPIDGEVSFAGRPRRRGSMTRTMVRFLLAGAFALMSLPALAADPSPRQQQTVQAQETRLESGLKTLALQSNATKLGAAKQAEVSRQKSAIHDMIRRLEAGEQVAPGEIDRVLQAR